MKGMNTRTTYFHKAEHYETPKLDTIENLHRHPHARLIRQLTAPEATINERVWKVKDMHGKTKRYESFELAMCAAEEMLWARLSPVLTKQERSQLKGVKK
jgi:hypothetical protein